MGKKSTLAISTERTMIVYEMLLAGAIPNMIIRYASENWQIGSRQAENYIQKANQIISQRAQEAEKNLFAHHLMSRREMRSQAIEAGDSRLAFDLLRDEAKLVNLYPPSKQQNLNIDLGQLTDEQLEKLANGKPVTDIVEG